MPRISVRSIRYRRPKNPTWDIALERTLVLDPASISHPMDLSGIFGRSAPVEIEIGFGKGRFLLAAAAHWPDTNWLGIEYAGPCVQLVAERAAKRGLRNIRLIRADAALTVEDLPDSSIRACHIYFPDPWPKKRHRKRRLIKQPFVERLFRTIAPGGWLHLATDFEDYFAEIVLAAQRAGFMLVDLPADGPEDDEVFRTNYEKRFLERGTPIYRARFRRPRSE